MDVHFEAKGRSALLHGLVLSRAQYALRRIGWLVPIARVRLSELHGLAAGKRCEVVLEARDGGAVRVVSRAPRWSAAIDAALRRAAQSALRAWRLRREHRFHRPPLAHRS